MNLKKMQNQDTDYSYKKENTISNPSEKYTSKPTTSTSFRR